MRAHLIAALALLLVACAPPAHPPGELLRSPLQRDTAPQVPEADRDALVGGNLDFALALHRQVSAEPGNVVTSPHGISLALAMAYAGARGLTETQMASALSFALPQARLHPAFNWLDLELASRNAGGSAFRLEIANAAFGQEGYGFESAYLDVLARSYGAGLYLLDFEKEAEAARRRINAWISARTDDRIPELIGAGAVDASTRLVLANAVFFKADWKAKFEKADTEDAPFHLLDGTTVPVPTMEGPAASHAARGEGWLAVALPYQGETVELLVVVPDDLPAFEAGLDAATLQGIVAALQPTSAPVALPKVEFRFRAPLRAPLEALGMTDAFAPGRADLSGMDGTRELFISAVLHEAFLKMDEDGTEAAAGTAVVVGVVSVPPEAIPVNRPFLFFVRDRPTGAILFLGRVVDPRAG